MRAKVWTRAAEGSPVFGRRRPPSGIAKRVARETIRRALTATLAAGVVYVLTPGCSLGQGQGVVSGSLNVPNCWSGRYDLNPDFFAATPYRDSVTIRVQNGGDYETFSDGVSILVDNVHVIRGDAPFGPALLHTAIPVSLPPSVVPPGVPIQAVPNPAPVHLTLYLGFSCHTQNVALYAVNQVTLNAQGTCDATDSGSPIAIQCNGADGGSTDAAPDGPLMEASTGDASAADAAVDASPVPLGTATSTITFDSLYNANPDESDADQRHTVVPFFDVYLADPRDVCPGGLGPPPPCRGHLTGRFDFYFERGRPAQPFP